MTLPTQADIERVWAESHVVPTGHDMTNECRLAARILSLTRLVADAKKLLEPLEWIDDRGRECAWCQATRHTFKADAIPRDNHRADCRWLAFIKAAEAES